MKKLMIAAAIVCAAVVVQAAGYQWKSGTTGGILYNGTSDTKAASGTVLYLFMDAGQSDIFGELAKGTDISTLGAVRTTTLTTASKITQLDFTGDDVTGTHDFFFATIFKTADDKDAFYISSMKEDVTYASTGAGMLSYSDLSSTSKTTLDVSAGFKGAGVYSAVPEPTSGLLLLLGVAGLALRRRRA